LSNGTLVSIIDDDEFVRDGVGNLVRSLGYEVIVFSSAEDYLSSDRNRSTSCIIADIQMPGMNGDELQSRMVAAGNRTPIIFMTAFPNERTRTHVLQAGACGYLRKPFDDNAFVQCLEKALSERGRF
jgi:FixJ family two-component response regulator